MSHMDVDTVTSTMKFEVSWGKQTLHIEIEAGASLRELKEKIEDLTDVPIEGQKIFFKQAGIPKPSSDDVHLADLINASPLQPVVKIMLIGSKREEIAQIQSQKASAGTFERPKVKTAAARDVREIAKLSDSGFQNFQVLPFARKDDALKLLHKLATDIGIASVMKKYGFKVGLLSELDPAVHDKLGFNKGRGIEISLRLRIGDGFRAYHLIKETLVHELAHMHWDEHDHRFHAFNRQLLKETSTGGGQRLGGEKRFAGGGEEEEELEHSHDAFPQRLGGSAIPTDLPMRELLYQAAVMRLSAREQELVDHCGQPETSATSSPPTSSLAPLAALKEEKKTAPEPTSAPAAKPVAKATLASPAAPLPSAVVSKPLPALSKAAAASPECPICGKQLPLGYSERDISRHVDECLQKSTPVASTPVAAPPTTDLDVQSQSATACPICGNVFSGVSNRTINNHIDECLKSMS